MNIVNVRNKEDLKNYVLKHCVSFTDAILESTQADQLISNDYHFDTIIHMPGFDVKISLSFEQKKDK